MPANRGLSKEERSRRLATSTPPIMMRSIAALTRRMADRRPTALIAIHSFTPVYFGKARPWQVGILFDDDRRLADLLIGGLSPTPPSPSASMSPIPLPTGSITRSVAMPNRRAFPQS